MRQLGTAAMAVLLLASSPARAEPANVRAVAADRPACTLAFQSNWNRLDFAVGVDRVRGSGVTLTRHGDVISGFLYGAATRLHRKGNKLSGVIAGAEATIYVERDGQTLILRGDLPGLGRATIFGGEGKLSVFSDRVTVELAREAPGLLRGEVKAGDRYGDSTLRLTNCSNSLLVSRPEILLAIAMAPLAR